LKTLKYHWLKELII